MTLRQALVKQYQTAVRYLLVEQSRNRLAVTLLVLFVPGWYALIESFLTGDPVGYRLRFLGRVVDVNGQRLGLITAGLNAITLIVGFVSFTATRRGMQFDRRLVLCGFRRWILILAKLTSLTTVALTASLYAAAIFLVLWRPVALPLVVLGFFAATLAYGAFGLFLGVLVRGELEGFFLVIMVSLTDTFLQNPTGNPAANQHVVEFFPSFAPTQVAVAGGFTHTVPWAYLLLSLAWPAGLTALSLAVFSRRTRVAVRYVHAAPLP
jgi:ABC-2 type transport system permease protein